MGNGELVEHEENLGNGREVDEGAVWGMESDRMEWGDDGKKEKNVRNEERRMEKGGDEGGWRR